MKTNRASKNFVHLAICDANLKKLVLEAATFGCFWFLNENRPPPLLSLLAGAEMRRERWIKMEAGEGKEIEENELNIVFVLFFWV